MINEISTNFSPLYTERLILRPLQSADDSQIFKLRSNQEINRYTNRIPAKTIEDAQAFITMITNKMAGNEAVYLGICLRAGELIGTICLANIEDGQAEIGFELLPEFHRKGIMHEAIAAMRDYAAAVLKLESLIAVVKMDNEPSLKLLAKNNFRTTEKLPHLQDEELGMILHLNVGNS